MLDDLLGRAELKERIAELEAERDELTSTRDRLQAQLEAESDRRRSAVTDRQEAEREVNRLNDRIADLEGKLDRLQSDDPAPDFRGVETLRGRRLDNVLSRLESWEAGTEGALTAVVDDDVPTGVSEAFGDHGVLIDRAAPCVALTDDAGLISAALTAPTNPPSLIEWENTFQFERSWFQPHGEFGLALVRSDLFAFGQYSQGERIDFEGFESVVHGNHSKGGYSQARFERRRDDQIADHLDRCRTAIENHTFDGPLYLVGDRSSLRELGDLAETTATVDATGDPQSALKDAYERFWTVRLYRI